MASLGRALRGDAEMIDDMGVMESQAVDTP